MKEDYPVVVIPGDVFQGILACSRNLKDVFRQLRHESELRGMNYSPDLSFTTWFDRWGNFCQQNCRSFKAHAHDRETVRAAA